MLGSVSTATARHGPENLLSLSKSLTYTRFLSNSCIVRLQWPGTYACQNGSIGQRQWLQRRPVGQSRLPSPASPFSVHSVHRYSNWNAPGQCNSIQLLPFSLWNLKFREHPNSSITLCILKLFIIFKQSAIPWLMNGSDLEQLCGSGSAFSLEPLCFWLLFWKLF